MNQKDNSFLGIIVLIITIMLGISICSNSESAGGILFGCIVIIIGCFVSIDLLGGFSSTNNTNRTTNTNNKQYTVKCPYCNSPNCKKIGTGSKMVSAYMTGIASSKIGKQWHCNNCNSDF